VLELAKHCPVRDALTGELYDRMFKGSQPESMTLEEWETAIRPHFKHVTKTRATEPSQFD
jgi:hypothetical protein